MRKRWLQTRVFFVVFTISISYVIVLILAFSMGGASVKDLGFEVLFQLRGSRIFMGILIGVMLASSGVVVQSVFANPLADPYIIGVAASATLGAVSAYLLGLPDIYYGIFGFVFSVAVSFVIFAIGRHRDMATLLMLGVAISAFVGAFTTFAIYLIGEDSFKITAWLMGYLGNANWDRVIILAIAAMICSWYFFSKRLELNILLLGDEEARSLGVNVSRLKIQLLIVSSLAVGFCVGFSGLIGFVGLIIPHILRLVLGNSNHAIILPLSFFLGGLFLLACDTFGRVIWLPIEIPIGVITAFFGAPFFLYLALKRR
ncbi:iron ABC transporter [Helicobacter didelphidarum]|uniref:Iron ABC transporter n=1 Tax=Helicobacter didelphidarum TaxID=2040648 RepID=A0A3D8ISZ1_9HELI|nr:iron ABC transporter permease [Helicobacter didelphidarum]RDU67701.1 iron ABC transporter [Helicobacter didelphidarum]